MAYTIQLPQFQGPLELLSTLIDKRKLDVTLVSLATVTDQYLEYLSLEKTVSLEHLSSFLVIASRLILIKSKALLPQLVFDEEDEEEIIDLERRLKEYRIFQKAAQALGICFARGNRMYSRERNATPHGFFYPPQNLTKNDLHQSFTRVLESIPVPKVLQEESLAEVLSLEDRIASLQIMVRRKAEISFTEIIASSKDRAEVIVSFLALLELVKQRMITVEQKEGLFGNIRISSCPL